MIRTVSKWDSIKHSGETVIPAGDATNAYKHLKQVLIDHKIYLVPVGKLEGFVKEVLNKKQRDFAKLIDYPVGKYADFENGKIESYWFTDIGVIAYAENFDWFMNLVRARKYHQLDQSGEVAIPEVQCPFVRDGTKVIDLPDSLYALFLDSRQTLMAQYIRDYYRSLD